MTTVESAEKMTVADRVVALARQRYELGCTSTGEAYARREGSHVIRSMRGTGGLRTEVAALYLDRYGQVPRQQALTDALTAIEGLALHQPPADAHLRVAAANHAVWVDTARGDDAVFRIGPDTWDTVLDGVPVLFRRSELTAPYPEPKPGGSVDWLWNHVNVNVRDRPLLLAWMIDALINPDTAKPVLAVTGEQGSGKSTTCNRLVALVDPSTVPLRQPPRDPDQWTVQAGAGSRVVALDNMSTLQPWLSDALCRAATGDGLVKRALYTDTGLSVVRFRRSIVLNGIDWGSTPGDLADRIVPLELDRIDDAARLREREAAETWTAEQPRILHALLDLAAQVLGQLSTVELPHAPRMADFARVVATVDQLMGTSGMDRYQEHRQRLASSALDGNPFITALVELGRPFYGTSAELLTHVDAPDGRMPRGWPTDAAAVTNLVKRNAPQLRRLGWAVEEDLDRHRKAKTWRLDPDG